MKLRVWRPWRLVLVLLTATSLALIVACHLLPQLRTGVSAEIGGDRSSTATDTDTTTSVTAGDDSTLIVFGGSAAAGSLGLLAAVGLFLRRQTAVRALQSVCDKIEAASILTRVNASRDPNSVEAKLMKDIKHAISSALPPTKPEGRLVHRLTRYNPAQTLGSLLRR